MMQKLWQWIVAGSILLLLVLVVIIHGCVNPQIIIRRGVNTHSVQ